MYGLLLQANSSRTVTPLQQLTNRLQALCRSGTCECWIVSQDQSFSGPVRPGVAPVFLRDETFDITFAQCLA